MKKKQSEKYAVFQQILFILGNYGKFFTGMTRLLAEITIFKNAIKSIDDINAQIQPKASKPKTADKKAAKGDLINQIVVASKLIKVWAIDLNDTQLITNFSLTANSFSGGQTKVIQLATFTYNLMDTHRTDITNHTDVTSTQIDNILLAINKYKSLLAAPSSATTTQKTIKSLLIPAFKTADKSQSIIQDLIIGTFTAGPKANPQLITDFTNALEKPDNVLHTILTVTFKDALTGQLLEGALVEITELKKQALSSILGIAQIKEFSAGTYHVTFSLTGYNPQTQVLTFQLGKKYDIEILLTK